MKLDGKIALITGAATGIGKSVALKFVSEGAYVIINYLGNKNEAQELLDEITASGGKGEIFDCDVSKFDDVKNMMEKVIDTHKRIDILVNNAGITKDNLIMRMSEEEFDSVIRINLKGSFNTIKGISRYMIKQKCGKIINMASVVGITGNAGQANYAASKAGVIAITKSAAKEFASRNINVNAIAPGYVATNMTAVLNDKVKEEILDSIPMKKVATAEDIAKVALFLASDDSNYITGQVINVDGGMVM